MKKLLGFAVPLIYFTTPFESVAVMPGVSVVKLVTILFLLIALLHYKNITLPRSSFLTLYLLYALLTIISTIWSIDRLHTLNYALGTILPGFIVVLFLYRSVNNKKDIDNVFKAYAMGSLIVGLIALFGLISYTKLIEINLDTRIIVLGQDPNELSFLLSWGIASFIYLLKYTDYNIKVKVFYVLSIMLLAYVILHSGSRTGFVILISIGFIVFLMHTPKGKIIYVVPLLIVASIVLFRYLPDAIVARLFETSDQIREGDFTNRGNIWIFGFQAFQEEGVWLQGTGFKTFRFLMEKHHGWSVSPHNTYLSTLIELGITGLVVFLILLTDLCLKVFSLYRRESIYFSLLIIPIMLAMITLGTETRRWLFLLGVLIVKLYQLTEKSSLLKDN